MSRIPGGSIPSVPLTSPGVLSEPDGTQPSTGRAGVSRADLYARTGHTSGVTTNHQPTIGSYTRPTAVTGSQAVGPSAPAVQLDPMAMLGNLHAGDINIELPLDKSLINHPLVNVRDGAKAKVRWAVTDGQIDFKNSRVQIEGVDAAGLLAVRGAYLDDSGQLRLDMAGPDINITKAAIGAKRMPRSMEQFAQAVGQHYGAKAQAQSDASSASSTEADATQRFAGLTFDAKGIALRPDRAISLGDGNNINFQPSTRIDLAGNLEQVSLSGRAGINGVTLQAGGTEVNLGKGDVELRATASYGQDGLRADLSLNKLNLDVNRISHSMNNAQGVDLQHAQVRDGEIRTRVEVDSQGKTTIPYLHTKGEFAAQTMRYDDGGRVLESNNVQLGLNA